MCFVFSMCHYIDYFPKHYAARRVTKECGAGKRRQKKRKRFSCLILDSIFSLVKMCIGPTTAVKSVLCLRFYQFAVYMKKDEDNIWTHTQSKSSRSLLLFCPTALLSTSWVFSVWCGELYYWEKVLVHSLKKKLNNILNSITYSLSESRIIKV